MRDKPVPGLAEVTSPLFASEAMTGWKSLVLNEQVHDPVVADALAPVADAYCIVVVTGGEAFLESWDGQGWSGAEYRPGTVALISPGRATRFRWRALGPDPLRTAHLLLPHDAMRTAARELGLGRRAMTLRDSAYLSDAPIAATTHALLDAGRSGAAEAYVHSAAAFLAMHMLTRYAATSVAVDELTPRVLGVFRDAVGRTTSLRELAALAGVGEARLAQVVREATGQSPWNHLITLRVAEAKRLLATTALPVTEIGYRCGFATPSHFAASFRRATGTTPTRWRATTA
ncbi:AraC family transcriptional regulator [Amycolatopsis sp. GM8]|uniref:helix-turn-helix domain-containing protein n=1 Tax=Amycolatopsis sp. GM8 TaxID=2896530 RepID=UPI001F2AA526|nr:AraC family transcriptional regulator [Amycolatopsis sp. GM8]